MQGRSLWSSRWEEGKAHVRVRDAEAHGPSYGDRRDQTKFPCPWWPQSLLSTQPELFVSRKEKEESVVAQGDATSTGRWGHRDERHRPSHS